MNCQNCDKEIPDGAASCLYCEAKQTPLDPAMMKAAIELLQSMSPEVREILRKSIEATDTADELVSLIFCPACPTCSSGKVETCDEIIGIENPMVGRCMECCALFCTECEQLFADEKTAAAARPSDKCPTCESADTSFDEDIDAKEVGDWFECYQCNTPYCTACGKAIPDEDDAEFSASSN
jgi:hypothetical protein